MARTPKLTDLQLILLSTAAARDDGNVFPLKECIAGKAADVAKAIMPLLKRRLVIEHPETVLVRVWREDTDQRIGLAITDAGRALIDGGANGGGGDDADGGTELPAPVTPAASPAASPAPRTVTKTEIVLDLLTRDGGATTTELVAATGWLPHTVRAALTGLRKKGHVIERSRRDDTACYTIAAKA